MEPAMCVYRPQWGDPSCFCLVGNSSSPSYFCKLCWKWVDQKHIDSKMHQERANHREWWQYLHPPEKYEMYLRKRSGNAIDPTVAEWDTPAPADMGEYRSQWGDPRCFCVVGNTSSPSYFCKLCWKWVDEKHIDSKMHQERANHRQWWRYLHSYEKYEEFLRKQTENTIYRAVAEWDTPAPATEWYRLDNMCDVNWVCMWMEGCEPIWYCKSTKRTYPNKPENCAYEEHF